MDMMYFNNITVFHAPSNSVGNAGVRRPSETFQLAYPGLGQSEVRMRFRRFISWVMVTPVLW